MTKEERKLIKQKYDDGDLELWEDSVEWQIWRDTETHKKYLVPCEKVRFWEEVEDVHEFKERKLIKQNNGR
tara:strand:+ start:150 stop:362 length:213 start_codon:yes stop_codon:yes gene_type:complete